MKWQCPKCETYNEEEFCKICGEQRPEILITQQGNQQQNSRQQRGQQQGAQNQGVRYYDVGGSGAVTGGGDVYSGSGDGGYSGSARTDYGTGGYSGSGDGGYVAERPVEVKTEKRSKKGVVTVCVMLGIIAILLCVIAVALFFPGILNKDDKGKTASNENQQMQGGESPDRPDDPDEPDNPDNLDDPNDPDNPEEPEEPKEPDEKKDDLVDMRDIESYISNNKGNAEVGLCVIDLKNDAVYKTSDADRGMSASAMINIPILYTAYKNSEKGANLNESVVYKHTSAGRGKMTAANDGQEYGLRYLLEQMLLYSDNNVTNSLIDHFGRENINRVSGNSGYNSVKIQRHIAEESSKDNYISAADLAMMVAEMYQSEGLLDKSYLKENFVILDAGARDGIGKKLPDSAMFLNHNGITDTTYNEVAIVSSDKAEYVIAFMANREKKALLKEISSELSEYVFDSLDK